MDVESLRQEYEKASPMVKAFIEQVAVCISETTDLACNPDKIAAAQKPQ
jgi:hypothetical protein